MRILFILLSITFFSDLNWLSETEIIINEINSKSKIQSFKKNETDIDKIIITKYKLKEYSKLEITIKRNEIDTLNFQYYSKKDFVFANLTYYIAPYFLQKGVQYPGRSQGNLKEEKIYFKNKNEGLKFSRSLEYFENSNIDSLKLALQKNKFDTTSIGNDEYLEIASRYKRMSKKKNIRSATNNN